MDSTSATWLPHSVFRSPAWRWHRACALYRQGRRTDRRVDDQWTARARDFLAAGGRHAARHDSGRHGPHAPHIQAALEVWEAVPQAPRWLLEAHLLTGVPLHEVAQRCGLSAEVVQTYHQLFFDVRGRLRATDWVMIHVVGTYALKGFAGLPVGAVWKYAAFTAGPHALEVVVALTTGAPLPAWVREGLVGGASAEARFRQLGELSLGAMTAETPAEWAALIRTRDRLRRGGPEATGTRAEQDRHLRAMERFLMGRGRRKGRGREPVVKADDERAAPVEAVAVRRDGTAVHARQLPHEVQAEPRPAATGRVAGEQVEHVCHGRGHEAEPVVRPIVEVVPEGAEGQQTDAHDADDGAGGCPVPAHRMPSSPWRSTA
jgi:hypothetical protein